MAFDATDLVTQGTGGTNSIHHYTTTDADTVVETAAYFDSVYTRLKAGDFIMASLDTDGTIEGKIYFVTASSSSGVTIGFPTIA